MSEPSRAWMSVARSGRQQMARPVEMRLEIRALFRDDAPLRQAEDLEAAAVGEDRPLPADEAVQAAATRDQLVAGTQQQVIRVGEDDLGARLFEVAVASRLDGTLRADRHERRRLHDAVRRLELAETRRAVGASHGETESALARLAMSIVSFVKKLRVGVIYGGRSGEHEVSVASAASIFKHLDRARYEAVPIRIEKSGQWVLGGKAPEALSAADGRSSARATEALQPVEPSAAVAGSGLDVVFPVLHGPYGEDGTVQGLLELANVPYVGAGVLGSAVGMDKAVMKTLFAARGLPIVPHLTVLRREWPTRTGRRSPSGPRPRCAFPCSSSRPTSARASASRRPSRPPTSRTAMELAFQFDRKIVVEAAVPNAREIECAVLGNDEPEASVPGEIIVTHRDDFYDYDAKYLDPTGASWKIPADIPAATAERVRRVSVEAFRAVELAGMARVDFLLDGERRRPLPQRGQHDSRLHDHQHVSRRCGKRPASPYPALLDRLIALALERHAEKQRLRTSIT